MKLVWYLYRKILPLFFGAMIFFALVLNLVDLFMHIATYLQNNVSVKDIAMVMAFYVPKTVWYAVPVAILFSTSYSLSDMYASNELEALFASGVSLFRFTLPVLLLSVLLSFGLFFFENRYVVSTYEKKTELQDHLLNKVTNENNSDVIVLSDNGRIVYKARRYIESTKKLSDAYFVFRDDNKTLLAVIYAPSAFWDEENLKWNVQGALQYTPSGQSFITGELDSALTDALTESYEIFRKSNVDVQSVSAREAKIYIEHLKKAGLPYNEQLSEYYKKFAFPFIVFIVVFLSVGLTGKTKKNVLLISLASCISASVLFYVTMMVTMVFAKHGYISPFMGAWFPVIFYTIASVILLRYSRT